MPVVEVADDSPTAATGDMPEPSLPDPSAAPRSSPQRSPQRKSGFYPSARRGALGDFVLFQYLDVFVLTCAEVEPQRQERPETVLEEPQAPPSPTRPNSPARESAPPRAGTPPRQSTPPRASSPARAATPPRPSSPAREPAAEDVRQGNLCNLSSWLVSFLDICLSLEFLCLLLLSRSSSSCAHGDGGDYP